MSQPSSPSPFDPPYPRGNCGIGFVADRRGRPSHAILRQGLQALINLEHRGALDADARTGDGAGLLTPLPRQLFAREAERLAGRAPDPSRLAVGVFFARPGSVAESVMLAESELNRQGQKVLAWRDVPVFPDVLGERARETMPRILHAIVELPPGKSPAESEQALYLTRKGFERQSRAAGLDVYVPSFSSRTIVYKGLLLAPQLPAFYADLQDPGFEIPLVVFHQRYSTNTLPSWRLAQPFRVLCHNGEINTLQGNINWMRSREPLLSAGFVSSPDELRPVVDTSGSDSAMLDNAAELLMMGGRDIRHALTMLVPPAWERQPELPEAVRAFYAYHACLTEPWDGPAALVFTDGRTVGAALDRNGLRPCRYLITDDGLVVAGSEAGAIRMDDDRVLVKGRLGPGQMLAVDTATGTVKEDEAIKAELAARRPYGAWVRENVRRLEVRSQKSKVGGRKSKVGGSPSADVLHDSAVPHNPPPSTLHPPRPPRLPLVTRQAAFGFTSEELVAVIRPMVEDRAEAVGSMGDDTAVAALSDKPRPLFGYFRQRFAEVTNPPIDPLREELVMSLRARVGARGNFLSETMGQARLVELESPLLTDLELDALRADPELSSATLSTLFPAADGAPGLECALDRVCAEAEAAVRNGAQIVVLSDRGVDAARAFIPSLLAVGAVHNHLLRADLRALVDIVVESGEPREVHHFAALIGYGAAAINPYLALETAVDSVARKLDARQAEANFLHAASRGVLKILSKMGISTVDAYCGAQIFETVGVQSALIERYFTGTTCHLEGIGLEGIAGVVLRWHRSAFEVEGRATLESPGFYKFKRNGELHAFSPAAVTALHEAVKTPGALDGRWPAGYGAYKKYSRLQHDRPPTEIRDLLDFHSDLPALPLDSVEPATALFRRFSTAAMSHGSLSAEAHATLSVAMNRLGAMSNAGEGGEHPSRYGTDSNSPIKQVASARFGVTPAYLVSADELQIKMAQGSKPGEGGHLPGHKVTAEIAAIRHATPGLSLISPPPHHDIYSIEDLAQLIYDLRQINPRAVVSVKLVAQAGVGTIATGVAKAGADVILISGSAGGTGASPLSSIKYAGVPWEIGLAEAQYMLVRSGLRGRVRLRADGGLRTGRDVVIAALLGADEYSFGTAAMVAEGCLMARACHLNTCPAGIATQREDLRARFDPNPDRVIAFMTYVAEEVREILSRLGLRSIDEAVGRADVLRQAGVGRLPDEALDLSRLLLIPPGHELAPRRYLGEPNRVPAKSPLNDRLLSDARPALEVDRLPNGWAAAPEGVRLRYDITNRDRTFGARLGGEIARQFGDDGIPEGSVKVVLRGSAGQSFGAFGVPGLSMTLVGEANDYVGKGLGGGRIVIRPPRGLRAESPVLAGNTVLYGATGGEVHIAGRAGERFAVRNSGAAAVVEGVGDHGCEYMTGGRVMVLGPVGNNFAAGMTGGVAYVYNEDGEAASRVNRQLVDVEAPTPAELELLKGWLHRHAELTGSPKARAILVNWRERSSSFLRVHPKELPPAPAPVALAVPAMAEAAIR